MSEKNVLRSKKQFYAAVSANKHIGWRFYRLTLELSGAGAEAFSNCQPGQFAQLDLTGAGLPPQDNIPEDLRDVAGRNILLRRPFSFADVTVEENRTFIDILYAVVGPASLRMTTLSAGNCISIIGPLGSGFWVPEGKKRAILVAGGTGAGPLQFLAKTLATNYSDIEVTALAGAKTVKELPFEKQLDEISQQLGFSLKEFAKYGVKSMVATEDGSAGYQGTVIDCLLDWLGQPGLACDTIIIYACGPEAMLAKVAEIAKDKKIDCQISMERRMACGIGTCQSCVVDCKANGLNIYKLCCKDGPVFDSKEVVFPSPVPYGPSNEQQATKERSSG